MGKPPLRLYIDLKIPEGASYHDVKELLIRAAAHLPAPDMPPAPTAGASTVLRDADDRSIGLLHFVRSPPDDARHACSSRVVIQDGRAKLLKDRN